MIDTLAEVMVWRGIPEHLRSENGPEFIAQESRKWLGSLGTRTLYIEPGSPWETGYLSLILFFAPILGTGIRLTLIGLAIGPGAAMALVRFLGGKLSWNVRLNEVKRTDPATLAVVCLLLAVVALLACYIPARRATKVDPMVAL